MLWYCCSKSSETESWNGSKATINHGRSWVNFFSFFLRFFVIVMKERCLVIDLWYTCMNFRSLNYFNFLLFPFCCSGMGRKNKFSGSASSNLVGKFTQSVRRIVQDVKDEGSPSKFNVSFRVPFRVVHGDWHVLSKPRRETTLWESMINYLSFLSAAFHPRKVVWAARS